MLEKLITDTLKTVVHMAVWKISSPMFQNTSPPLKLQQNMIKQLDVW